MDHHVYDRAQESRIRKAASDNLQRRHSEEVETLSQTIGCPQVIPLQQVTDIELQDVCGVDAFNITHIVNDVNFGGNQSADVSEKQRFHILPIHDREQLTGAFGIAGS